LANSLQSRRFEALIVREFDHGCVKIAHRVIAFMRVSMKNQLGIIDAK